MSAEIPKQTTGPSTGETPRLATIREIVTGEFDGQLPDVFFLHTGGMSKHKRGPMGYKSTAYSQLSEHGIATGGRTRIIAGAEIAEALPELKIVTNSFNRFDPEEPSMASVNKEELVRRGIDPDRVIMEEGSFSSVTQLIAMVRLAVENNWQRVMAMTNEYHLPRMSEMYSRLDQIIDDAEFQETLRKFKDQGTRVEFVCAEDILRMMGDHMVSYLEEVEQMPAFAHTRETEAQGLQDLRAGKYRVVLRPEAPRVKNQEN